MKALCLVFVFAVLLQITSGFKLKNNENLETKESSRSHELDLENEEGTRFKFQKWQDIHSLNLGRSLEGNRVEKETQTDALRGKMASMQSENDEDYSDNHGEDDNYYDDVDDEDDDDDDDDGDDYEDEDYDDDDNKHEEPEEGDKPVTESESAETSTDMNNLERDYEDEDEDDEDPDYYYSSQQERDNKLNEDI